jgi:hypothetical protein
LLIALAGALFLGACTGGSSTSKKSSAQATNSSSASGSASASKAPSATETNGQGSKTVAPPSGGNVSQTVPDVTVSTASAVPLTASSQLATGVVVTLSSIKAITVAAEGPGEVAGPALAVTVHVVNGTDKPVDLSSTFVTLLNASGNVGSPTPASPAAPFSGIVQPKAAADGVYVFNIATTERNPVNVYVTYSAGAPTAHFVGNAS